MFIPMHVIVAHTKDEPRIFTPAEATLLDIERNAITAAQYSFFRRQRHPGLLLKDSRAA